MAVALSVALMAACGSGDGDRQVSELSDSELEALCEEFHDAACQNGTEDFCTSTCRGTCRNPGTAALVRQRCPAPFTVAQTRECAELYGAGDESAFAVCVMGGGCVFDVFDDTCD